MKDYKVFLQEIDYSKNLATHEYLFQQINYVDDDVKEELTFNEDGSLAERSNFDFENGIEIAEDFKNKLKLTTIYVYDENDNLIKEMELEEPKNKIVERNYEVDEVGHVIRQEFIADGITETIKFNYDNREIISTEHFIDGKLDRIYLNHKDINHYNYEIFDSNGQQIGKTIHLFGDNGLLNSISEYDGKDNLIKITTKYNDEEGYTVYETNHDFIENTFVEEISKFIGPEEYSSRIEKYYENMELVLEKRFRYEYELKD